MEVKNNPYNASSCALSVHCRPADVAWNFETVLFDKTGKPYRRYATGVDPIDISGDIEYLLAQ